MNHFFKSARIHFEVQTLNPTILMKFEKIGIDSKNFGNYFSTWLSNIVIVKILPEFRFESPISISKWNNWLDFRRKSENYFKVKIFSDSRPKSAQKLILKVFSDFRAQNICRFSKIFKILIWCYTCARMFFLFAYLLRDQKSV